MASSRSPGPLISRATLALAVWGVLVAGVSLALAAQQQQARRQIEQRFALRATIAGRFVSTYTDGVIAHELDQGRRHLSATSVAASQFDRVVRDDGFAAAVLLDARGRLLQIFPRKPELIGADLAAKYAHLRVGVQGRTAISKVVPSAARGIPIVAFAVPFDTPQGRRVYSGAQSITSTSAGAYLRNAVSLPDSRLYLVDANGVVIAKNGAPPTGVRRLAGFDPALAGALSRHSTGHFGTGADERSYVSGAIDGAPWRVVVSVPRRALLRSVSGTVRWLPWLAVIGFALASLVAILMMLRLLAGRRRLAGLNDLLERIVRVDPLTDLANRRGLDEHLAREVSAARRHDAPLAVLLVDIDHFKRINDRHGHLAGDATLTQLAGILAAGLRTEDLLGRWGGEEFLAVLPGTDTEAAVGLAERLRERVAAHCFVLPEGVTLQLTISVGVAAAVDASHDARLAAADRALYEAKEGGRDQVVAAAPLTHV